MKYINVVDTAKLIRAALKESFPAVKFSVTPAMASTIASRVSVSRLNKVDFPTFGLPIIATTFAIIKFSRKDANF